jgi:hypothetical protein
MILSGSFRDAAELAGCSHHTVAQYVAARERGELTPGRGQRREMLVDPHREKLEREDDASHPMPNRARPQKIQS